MTGPSGEFPRGKLKDDDQGELTIAIGVRERTLIIDFGPTMGWIGMDKKAALEFGSQIINRAMEIK